MKTKELKPNKKDTIIDPPSHSHKPIPVDLVATDVINTGIDTVKRRITSDYTIHETGSIKVGDGDSVLKVSNRGIHMGAENFNDAPFSVDLDGNAVLNSALIHSTRTIVTPDSDTTSAFRVTTSNGSQIFDIDTTNGWLQIGEDQPNTNLDPNTILYITRTANSYFAVNMENVSSGDSASTDFILFNDVIPSFVGDYGSIPDTGYIDIGVTSSGFSDPDYAVYGASAEYIWVGDDLYIGTATPNHSIYFFMGGLDSTSYIKIQINSEGVLIPFKSGWTNAPNYVKGGIWFNTDLNKLMVGGVAGWEQITSAAVAGHSLSPSPSPSKSPSASPSLSPSV